MNTQAIITLSIIDQINVSFLFILLFILKVNNKFNCCKYNTNFNKLY